MGTSSTSLTSSEDAEDVVADTEEEPDARGSSKVGRGGGMFGTATGAAAGAGGKEPISFITMESEELLLAVAVADSEELSLSDSDSRGASKLGG